jgi:hypothetical protein
MFYIVFAVVCCLTFCHAGTIPEEAERLGAKTLVKLVTEAGLADTIPLKHGLKISFYITEIPHKSRNSITFSRYKRQSI